MANKSNWNGGETERLSMQQNERNVQRKVARETVGMYMIMNKQERQKTRLWQKVKKEKSKTNW